MKYTLFLYNDELAYAEMPPEAFQASLAAYQAYTQALQDAGVFVATDWLAPSATATTVSLRDGERRVQDGAYADTREQLGGYYVIEVPDLDAALHWAARCPSAAYGTIEIRPSAMG